MKLPMASGLATGAVMVTLYPLFNGGSWFWASLGAVLATTAVGVLSTRLGVWGWLVPPAMLVTLCVYMTATFTADEAWARVIPTKDSLLGLAGLMAEGFGDVQRFAAPVPANPGISLLTAAGVGLIAVLVDLFAVRLRKAALAGLPLLALFTVPAAVITEPIAWPAFAIGAMGYVGLLVADGRERLGHWGRAVLVRRSRVTTSGTTADTGRLALSGKRVGVTAIALAILLPALIPALAPAPLFGFGAGNGSGTGGNNIGIPDAIAKLSGQLTQQRNDTVLTYANSDDLPRYLRIYSLDIFDGQKWTLSPLKGRPEDRVSDGPLPPAPGLAAGIPVKRVESRITVSDEIEQLRFLPLPYPATQVDADGDWRADQASLMVFSTRDEAAGLEYGVVSGEPQPTRAQLDQAPMQPDGRYTRLPDGIDPRVGETAMQVTRGAATPYQSAIKLQQWFTKGGGFTYSLRSKRSGGDALSRFILSDRAGYCEQFASAMAVMARMLGIPARVSIGYTGGTKIGDSWSVRTHDAHAWPELYFAGVGWLRFEPTPAGVAGQGTARVPQYSLPVIPTASPTGGPAAASAPGADSPGEPNSAARRNPRQVDRDLGGVPVAADPGLPVSAKVGIGLGVTLLLTLLPAVARLLVVFRRRRTLRRAAAGAPPPGSPGGPESGVALGAAGAAPGEAATRAVPAVEAAWAELCDTLIDLGMPRHPDESPRALARRLTERYEFDAGTAAAVARIATAEERLRYAPTPGSSGPPAGDLRIVRRALAATVSRRRRVGAVLAPMSTLLRLRALGERLLDGFDLLENIRLRPRRNDHVSGPAEERRVLVESRRQVV